MRGEVWAGRWGGRGPAVAHERHAWEEGPAVKAGGGLGMRLANVKHVAHVRDTGSVEAERLVERRRPLPSRKEGVRCGARYGPGGERAWVGGSARAECTGGGPDSRLRARARAERTSNMLFMCVTLDVTKLSGWLNADAPCRIERRAYDARGEVRRAGVWGGGGARKRHSEGRPD